MEAAFQRALAFTLEHEGGYVNDPTDPGGETKYGISKRAHPNLDIVGLTRAAAAQIYQNRYWDRNRCGYLPECLAMAAFDYYVHSPRQTVSHALQKVVSHPGHKLVIDGFVGPKTIAAARHAAETPYRDLEMALSLTEMRLVFLARLIRRSPDTRLKYLTGWMRRCYWLCAALHE